MIEAKELRIGNWVDKEGTPIQIGSIEFAGFYYIYSSGGLMHQLKDIEPIPLAPEILDKTGLMV